MSTYDRSTTEGAARYFQNCVRNGDAEGALSCFDAEAVYIPTLGNVVKGTAEIKGKRWGHCLTLHLGKNR